MIPQLTIAHQPCLRSPCLCTSSSPSPVRAPSSPPQHTNTLCLFSHSQLDIPFQSRQQALVAEQALRPDPVLKPDQSRIEYSVCGSEDCGGVLRIDVQGVDDRVVRVTANNVLESLKTVVECLEEFEN